MRNSKKKFERTTSLVVVFHFSPLKNIEYIPRLLKEKKRGEKIFAEIFVDITNKTECFDYFNDIDDRIKFVEKSSSILIDSFINNLL